METIPLAQGTDVCTPGFSADETGSNRFLLLLFLALVILTLWFALRRSVRRLVELDYQLVARSPCWSETWPKLKTVEGSAMQWCATPTSSQWCMESSKGECRNTTVPVEPLLSSATLRWSFEMHWLNFRLDSRLPMPWRCTSSDARCVEWSPSKT